MKPVRSSIKVVYLLATSEGSGSTLLPIYDWHTLVSKRCSITGVKQLLKLTSKEEGKMTHVHGASARCIVGSVGKGSVCYVEHIPRIGIVLLILTVRLVR